MMMPPDTNDQTKKDHGKHKQERTAKVCKVPQSDSWKCQNAEE
jgi:hypothetical protein